MKSEAILLEQSDYTISHDVGSENINLGYASFESPQGVLRNPVREERQPIVTFNLDSEGATVAFLEPFQAEAGEMVEKYNRYFDPDIGTEWELVDLALKENGFSFIDMLGMSHRMKQRKMILHYVKFTQLAGCERYSRIEKAQSVFYIKDRDDSFNVLVRNKENGWCQGIWVGGSIEDNEPLLDSILQSYNFNPEIVTYDDIQHAFSDLGFPLINYESQQDRL